LDKLKTSQLLLTL